MLKIIQFLFAIILVVVFTTSLDFPPPPPPGAIGPFLNGIMPASTPGAEGAWELENPMPEMGIASPIRILPYPGTESDLLVLNKTGEMWRLSLENQEKELLLDIKDRTFNMGDGGAVGVALHPKFGDPSAPDKQLLFVYYRHTPNVTQWTESGYNRLSKFSWDSQTGRFDPDSELVLIQQFDRSTWHNGGGMFFDNQGFLYLSVGDEGRDYHQLESTQRLDGGFFNGVFRIDVDNDPSRSHPVRRQPLANADLPDGWTDPTFTQGYSIPNDNPWLDPDGGFLEEYYAIGARSPHAMYYDPETELIWLADVGAAKIEEINLVEKGDNLQWPYMEGTIPSDVHTKPAPDIYIGNEKPVYFEYDRSFGACVMGGSVYYGTKFPELNGKYLFADYSSNKLFALTNMGSQADPEIEVLLSNLNGQPVDLPESANITGIFPTQDGKVLVTIMGNDFDPLEGRIFSLKRKTEVPEPPGKLSDLGVFSDLETLTPVAGILPYRVNAPLWSDRAIKKRWIAVPNDGTFDTADEQITFQKDKEWTFPKGTVFIKHFELPTTTDPDGPTTKLETRFFVIGEDGVGYGVTYRWNPEGTEAFLLGGGASRDYNIFEDGELIYTQTWDFPSRGQCISCHNANAGYVLGVKTHQLNGNQYYPQMGYEMNQLKYLSESGMFNRNVSAQGQPKAYKIDDESAALETRIRSYLDANCSSCHRLGGVPDVTMDLRYSVPLLLANLVKFPTQSHSSNPNWLIVEPGSYQTSELYARDASTEANLMPPIGRNLVDEVYIDALIEWIGNLPEDYGEFSDILLFPNPSRGTSILRISDDWVAPYQIIIQAMNGQFIRQESFDTKSFYLDVHDLPAGIYVLSLQDGNNNRHTEQLVMQ